MMKYTVFILLCYSSLLNAFELAGEDVRVEEVLPLFNRHESSFYVKQDQKGINPKNMAIPDNVKLRVINEGVSGEGFISEIFFKDLIFKTSKNDFNVELKIHSDNDKQVKITPKIVTSWYQAGTGAVQNKFKGALTYELLLSDDRNFVINDKWVKSKKGGWIYEPPVIDLGDLLKTTFKADSYKRILLKVAISENASSGTYKSNLEVITYVNENKFSFMVPITINVNPIKLSNADENKYKRVLYTAFKINDRIDRSGAYVNTMRLSGTEIQRDELLRAYLADIKEHGFNGVTIRDWESASLEKTLNITRELGIRTVVLHATTPLSSKYKKMNNPIVSDYVKNIFDKYDVDLYYYGYDEQGGKLLLNRQLELNKEIHKVGGKSVNAVFWDDMPNVISTIKQNRSECFDIVAYSAGSHGHIKMFESLPYKRREDYCSKQGTEYLTYWHPHIENPVINRIFSGFWLWASGFDGVIPHGYYFPSHIEKVLSSDDLKSGVSTVASPYDDWSFWLPGNPLRHHNSVYPSKSGPVGTLQWEGVLSGSMDLKYILTLESKLDGDNLDKTYKDNVTSLLSDIRSDVLQIDSPYMNDKESIKYLKKLESWKKEISSLLLH